jgi:hypothetical protein
MNHTVPTPDDILRMQAVERAISRQRARGQALSPAEYAAGGWHYPPEHRSARWVWAALIAALIAGGYWLC